MRGIKCKNCKNLVNDWCDVKADSPDPAIVRDCVGFEPFTNGDRIRSMTDEELRDFLDKFRVETYTVPFGEKFCKNCPTTEGAVEGNLIPLRLHKCDFADGACPHGDSLMWWLEQKVVT